MKLLWATEQGLLRRDNFFLEPKNILKNIRERPLLSSVSLCSVRGICVPHEDQSTVVWGNTLAPFQFCLR